MARYTQHTCPPSSQTQSQFLLQVSHLGHVLTGCREKTQIQLLWLGHHRTEEEKTDVWEKAVVCTTLSPHTWRTHTHTYTHSHTEHHVFLIGT